MYGSAAELTAYWTGRGYSLAGLDDTAKEILLTLATDYVDMMSLYFSPSGQSTLKLGGEKTDPDQANLWPRDNVTDTAGKSYADGVIPTAVERAVYEAAFYAQNNENTLSSGSVEGQQVSREKFETVEFVYRDINAVSVAGSVSSTMVTIPLVQMHLAQFFTRAGDAWYGGVVA